MKLWLANRCKQRTQRRSLWVRGVCEWVLGLKLVITNKWKCAPSGVPGLREEFKCTSQDIQIRLSPLCFTLCLCVYALQRLVIIFCHMMQARGRFCGHLIQCHAFPAHMSSSILCISGIHLIIIVDWYWYVKYFSLSMEPYRLGLVCKVYPLPI